MFEFLTVNYNKKVKYLVVISYNKGEEDCK